LDKKIKGERKYFWMKKDFIKLVLLFFNWKMVGRKLRKNSQRVWVSLRTVQKTKKSYEKFMYVVKLDII
jgi:hypothetical protein